MVVHFTGSHDDHYLTATMDTASFNEQILQSQRPNFFELLAQEAMHEALRPAFQYICKVRRVREGKGENLIHSFSG